MDVKSRSGSLFRHQENKGKHGRKESRNHLRGPKRRSRIIFQHKKEKEKQRARRLDYQFKNKEKKYKGSCEAGSSLKENGDNKLGPKVYEKKRKSKSASPSLAKVAAPNIFARIFLGKGVVVRF